MIKVNLLDSVTERARTSAVVEEKVANSAVGTYVFYDNVPAVGPAVIYSASTDLDAAGASQTNIGFYLRAKVGQTYVAESEHIEVVYNRN